MAVYRFCETFVCNSVTGTIVPATFVKLVPTTLEPCHLDTGFIGTWATSFTGRRPPIMIVVQIAFICDPGMVAGRPGTWSRARLEWYLGGS